MPAARRKTETRSESDWGESLPDSFLMCRDMGHTWRPHSAAWQPEENSYQRVLRCPRCRTLRTQWISPSGHTLPGSHYTYPEGYTAPPGTGRIDGGTRDHLRLLSVLRYIEGHTTADNVRPLVRKAG